MGGGEPFYVSGFGPSTAMWQMTFLTVPSPPHQPWQLLLCCIFLNQTTRNQLDVVLMHFFERWNTPEKLLQARQDEIEGVIAPLGLQRRRTETVLRFTKEFLEKDWTDPLELHGIGEYAKAAYEIFCLGVIRPSPQDHALNWYADLFCRQ